MYGGLLVCWTNTSPLAIFSAPHLDYSVPSQCPPAQLVSFCCFQCRVAGKMGNNISLEIILFICYIIWRGGGESNTWRLGDKVTHDNCVVFWVLNKCFFLIRGLVYMALKTRETALDGTRPHLTNSIQLGFLRHHQKFPHRCRVAHIHTLWILLHTTEYVAHCC